MVKPTRILLVEDNESDAFLVRRALSTNGVTHELRVAGDGEDALNLLNTMASNPDGLPSLILMDLNLPRVDGFQLLTQIRAVPALSEIPIIVLSSSDTARDRELALTSGANIYFRKPTDLQSFMKLGNVVAGMVGRSEASVDAARAE